MTGVINCCHSRERAADLVVNQLTLLSDLMLARPRGGVNRVRSVLDDQTLSPRGWR